MTKILFVFPMIREEESPKHAPFGMAILSAVARRAGADVALYDMNAARSVLNTEEVFAELEDAAREGYDIVACGGLTTTYACAKRVAKLLRPILPDSLFIIGGNLLTSLPNEIMGWLPEYDIGIVGDAWETIIEVLDHCHDRNWINVKGIVYRNNTELKFTPIRPRIQNVDTLPFPAWDLLPMSVYFKNSSILLSEASWTAKKRIDLATSYGCPIRCLTADANVQTELGTMSIKEAVATHPRSVRGFDFMLGKQVQTEVLATQGIPPEETTIVEFEDGGKLEVSNDQELFTKRGYLAVSKLTTNDEVLA